MLDHARSGGLRAGYARPIGGSFRAELDTQKIALGGLCVTDFANANLAVTITFYRFCCCRAPKCMQLAFGNGKIRSSPARQSYLFCSAAIRATECGGKETNFEFSGDAPINPAMMRCHE